MNATSSAMIEALQAAQGISPADLLLRGVRIIDVRSRWVFPGSSCVESPHRFSGRA